MTQLPLRLLSVAVPHIFFTSLATAVSPALASSSSSSSIESLI